MKLNQFLKQHRKQELIEARLVKDPKSGEIEFKGGVGSKSPNPRLDWNGEKPLKKGSTGEIGRPTQDVAQDIKDYVKGTKTSNKMKNDSNDVDSMILEIKNKLKPWVKIKEVGGEDEISFDGLTEKAKQISLPELKREFNGILTALGGGSVDGSTAEEVAKKLVEIANEYYSGKSVFKRAAEFSKQGKGWDLSSINPDEKKDEASVVQKAVAEVLTKKAMSLSRDKLAEILDSISYDELEGLSPDRKLNKSDEEKEYDKLLAKKARKSAGQSKDFNKRKELIDKLWAHYFSKAGGLLSIVKANPELKATSTIEQVVKAAASSVQSLPNVSVKEEPKKEYRKVEGGSPLTDALRREISFKVKGRYGKSVSNFNTYSEKFFKKNGDHYEVFDDSGKKLPIVVSIEDGRSVVKSES